MCEPLLMWLTLLAQALTFFKLHLQPCCHFLLDKTDQRGAMRAKSAPVPARAGKQVFNHCCTHESADSKSFLWMLTVIEFPRFFSLQLFFPLAISALMAKPNEITLLFTHILHREGKKNPPSSHLYMSIKSTFAVHSQLIDCADIVL